MSFYSQFLGALQDAAGHLAHAHKMHPAVRALPASAETSPEAVGRYLAAHENDPWRLARAVHDYVADRVEYDVASYRAGVYPPQDAATGL